MPPTAVKAAIFTVAGQRIRAFDSPPVHACTYTPSISFFVECADEDEIRTLAAKLADGGGVMMPLNSYGFSTLFAWVADRFGVSWQLNLA
jgi:predicted 3-demethylubiquinone-9 3-methyltransferase (glyoxalase superfamily)